MGNFYTLGMGVDKDLATAFTWFSKAAEARQVNAMASLGICYENGNGVAQDYSKAVLWYTKGTRQATPLRRTILLCVTVLAVEWRVIIC
jgi:TPR repeat protein